MCPFSGDAPCRNLYYVNRDYDREAGLPFIKQKTAKSQEEAFSAKSKGQRFRSAKNKEPYWGIGSDTAMMTPRLRNMPGTMR